MKNFNLIFKNCSLTLIFLLLVFPTNPLIAQIQIVTIPNFYTTSPQYLMDFPSDNVGYIACKQRIYKTTNGGINWTMNMFSQLSNELRQFKFYNEQVGLLSNSQGQLYKTTNGGINWINVAPSLATSYYLFNFFSENEFITVSDDDSLYRTTNGALSWSSFSIEALPSSYYVASISKDGNNLYGIIYSPPYNASSLIKSTNHGQNWISTGFPGFGGYVFQSLAVVNGHIIIGGWKLSPNPAIFLWSGNENNVQFYNNYPGGNGECNWIKMFNNGYGYSTLISQGSSYTSLVKTTNYGQNWDGDTSITSFGYWNLTNSKIFALDTYSGSLLIKSQSVGVTLLNSEIPNSFELFQNYPNPFNPSTKIKFSINKNEFIQLKVFDLSGKEVKSLLGEELKPGTYNLEFNGESLSSGIYYYRMYSNSFSDTKKMVLLK